MATNYPNELDDFTGKTDDIDDIMSKHINDMQDAIVALETKIGIGAYSDTLHTLVFNFITSGRSVFVYKPTAPTGWSIVSSADRVLATSGGSGAYSGNGGTQSGTSWASLKGHAHLHNTHDHVVPNPHGHQWHKSNAAAVSDQVVGSGGAWSNIGYTGGSTSYAAIRADYNVTGIPDAYTDKQTENIDTYNGATGAQSTSDNRPTAAVGNIITKDAP